MTMRLEYWGHHITVDEPNMVGDCEACGGEIYDYELAICESCDSQIHIDCRVQCVCGYEGCRLCMLKIDDEYFCGPECKEDFKVNENI